MWWFTMKSKIVRSSSILAGITMVALVLPAQAQIGGTTGGTTTTGTGLGAGGGGVGTGGLGGGGGGNGTTGSNGNTGPGTSGLTTTTTNQGFKIGQRASALSNMNPLSQWYGYPLDSGWSNQKYFNLQQGTFGNPMFASTSTGGRNSGTSSGLFGGTTGLGNPTTPGMGPTGMNTGTTGNLRPGGTSATSGLGRGGAPGAGSIGGGPLTSGGLAGRAIGGGAPIAGGVLPGGAQVGSNNNLYRESQYRTIPAWNDTPRAALSVRNDLQDSLSRAGVRSGIRVMSDGQRVVLRGRVRDANERRMAEGLLRISPGVGEVVNELEVEQP
jgi:hypothetical protein